MHRTKRIVAALLLALSLVIGASRHVAYADESIRYNTEYIYATTRGLAETKMHPALKVTLFPVTLVIDTLLLPFAALAGFVS